MNGFRKALELGAEIIVKCDGDGQMNPSKIPQLIEPILNGQADYAKGNRFHEIEFLAQMPVWRLMGNAVLSFLSKISTGYWKIFDPTNGYIAMHACVAKKLPFDKISNGYFFESDVLFRLNVMRAVVVDVAMPAIYSDEKSHLSEIHAAVEFPIKHLRNFAKRIFYNYFLRDFNMGSLYLTLGVPLFVFGLIFGSWKWVRYAQQGQVASAGTVMLAALPFVIGMQFVLSFFNQDMQQNPSAPLQKRSV
jgi:glycosyltransferase involved in cell wall biosynthesis